MMNHKDLTPEFEEKLQELSAALVLVEADDPGSYQEVLKTIEGLVADPFAQGRQDVAERLKAVEKSLEACILDSTLFPDTVKAVEAALKQIRTGETAAEDRVAPPETDAEPAGTAVPVETAATAEPEAPPEPAPEDEAPGDAAMCDDKDLVEDFLLEAGENLESIEVQLLSLEQDPGNTSVINEIFRPFHTIKGVSGFLNLNDIHRLTHAVEDLLDKARNGEVAMGDWEVDIVLAGVDLLRRLLAGVRDRLDGRATENLSGVVKTFLERLRAGRPVEGAAAPAPGAPPLGRILEAQDKVSPEDLEFALQAQAEGEGGKKIGELLVEQNKVSPEDVSSALRVQEAMTERSAAGTQQQVQGPSTIKVDMYKLDNLVNMVGELVIAQSLIQQNPTIQTVTDHRLTRDFGQLSRITSELRDTTMTLRMVPIRQTFQKMIRLVRDLSRKSGKSVRLNLSGEDTEIDRNMVDLIYEPLVHLVRNGVDHGIESQENRKETGKPETGSLDLRAYHKGGNVVIEIHDDGKGLDQERILAKARDRGLLAEGETPSEQEIFQMIFRAGFSTAEKITDVSGRGVDMDVVKRTIEKLRGKIEVQSVKGKGSTFVIKLPITLAIIDGIVVFVGKERYIIPTICIKEAFLPRQEDYLTVAGKGELIRFRGGSSPWCASTRPSRFPTPSTCPGRRWWWWWKTRGRPAASSLTRSSRSRRW